MVINHSPRSMKYAQWDEQSDSGITVMKTGMIFAVTWNIRVPLHIFLSRTTITCRGRFDVTGPINVIWCRY